MPKGIPLASRLPPLPPVKCAVCPNMVQRQRGKKAKVTCSAACSIYLWRKKKEKERRKAHLR